MGISMFEKMAFEGFVQYMCKKVKERFPECEVKIDSSQKAQVGTYPAMLVKVPGHNMGPSLNLYQAYDVYLSEEPDIDEAAEKLCDSIADSFTQMPKIDANDYLDYTWIRDKLSIQLVNYEKNREYLKSVPHKVIEDDIAVIYRFKVSETENGTSTAVVTNSLLDSYGVTTKQLYEDALAASVDNMPAKCRLLFEVMNELMPIPMDPSEFTPNLYVVTNDSGFHGASVILYPGFLKHCREEMGDDFYIIPSSIHECLLVEKLAGLSKDEIGAMVCDVNDDTVLPEDVLSYKVYEYDAATDTVRLA